MIGAAGRLRIWLHVVAVLVVLVLVGAFPSTATATASGLTHVRAPSAANVHQSEASQLEEEKLREEIRQLRQQNDRDDSVLGWLFAFGPFVTVLVGVGGLLATLWKHSQDLTAARESAQDQAEQWAKTAEQQRLEMLHQRELETAERAKERVRRFDEHLAAVATNISSPIASLRINAAATFGLFVKPSEADLHCDLLNMVVANLKSSPDHEVGDLLRRHLAKLLRLLLDPSREPAPELGDRIDLTRIDLSRIDLSGLEAGAIRLDVYGSDLTGANMRGAQIRAALAGKCVLDGAVLAKADVTEGRFASCTATSQPANFRGARMVSINLKGAKLPRSVFEGAFLQGAHLQGADLRGALFKGADLADARFGGAALDDDAIRSLVTAVRWRKAFFDDAVAQELARLSAAGGGAARSSQGTP